MNSVQLPKELLSVIGDESIDFAVKSKRSQRPLDYIWIFIISVAWTGMLSLAALSMLIPLFRGEQLVFSSLGGTSKASLDNLQPLLIPSLGIGLFLMIGLVPMIWIIYIVLQEGGYFVGTKTRLLHLHKDRLRSYTWQRFSGEYSVNSKRDTLLLFLRYSGMRGTNYIRWDSQPDVIYISGTDQASQIEKLCRLRIRTHATLIKNDR